MLLRGVGAYDQNALGIGQLRYGVGHGPAAEGKGQGGYGGGMTEPGAVIDVVGLHHQAGELLGQVILLIAALG